MAKKSRVPSPPRKVVQAPKVRGTPRGPRTELTQRNRYILYGSAASGLAILALVVILLATGAIGGNKSSGKPAQGGGVSIGNMTTLPGIELGKPPWPAEHSHLKARADALGIPALSQEQLAFHIHQHLDIYVNGKHITVPQFIGINPVPGQVFFVLLHTHDTSGIIHVESPTQYDYTLGQFFGVWGLRLSKTCIGGLCDTAGKKLRVYSNGHLFSGDPTRIVLRPYDEIAVVYGPPPKNIPSSYSFPAGY